MALKMRIKILESKRPKKKYDPFLLVLDPTQYPHQDNNIKQKLAKQRAEAIKKYCQDNNITEAEFNKIKPMELGVTEVELYEL